MTKINLQITHAKKEQIYVKALIGGPSGSGKSYSALRVATGIAGRIGKGTKIGYIGTEGMRDKLYANEFDYDLISLEEYSPDYYEAAIDAFLNEGYKVIIVDSLTHLWGWVQDQVQKVAKSNDSSFQAWGKYKKENKKIIEKILLAPAHIIVTGRGKDEYVLEQNSKGKMAPRKVGVGVQQDKDIEYEYMVTWMLDQETHIAEAAKDNTHIFENKLDALTEKSGEALYDWANDGEPVKSPAERAAEVVRIQDAITDKCNALGGRENAELMEWYKNKFGGNHKANKDLDFLKGALEEMGRIKALEAPKEEANE
ncbi:MAG: ATP-binding protein [Clostridiales bacterium]|nr:ATP-binding protein [Clostridiales bacterium]